MASLYLPIRIQALITGPHAAFPEPPAYRTCSGHGAAHGRGIPFALLPEAARLLSWGARCLPRGLQPVKLTSAGTASAYLYQEQYKSISAIE